VRLCLWGTPHSWHLKVGVVVVFGSRARLYNCADVVGASEFVVKRCHCSTIVVFFMRFRLLLIGSVYSVNGGGMRISP
jgi:hypothetical protein